MAEQQQNPSKPFSLPNQIVGSVDMARVVRELEMLDDSLYQASIRAPGSSVTMPRSSRLLEEFASQNGISLLDQGHRKWLIEQAKLFRDKAPRIHMSFAVEPPAPFLQDILVWCRKNIHPYILVDVGLQPAIAVGVVARTNNRVFDLSLRQRLRESYMMLRQSIIDLNTEKEKEEVAAVAETTEVLPSTQAVTPPTPQAAAPQPVQPAAPQPQPQAVVQSDKAVQS